MSKVSRQRLSDKDNCEKKIDDDKEFLDLLLSEIMREGYCSENEAHIAALGFFDFIESNGGWDKCLAMTDAREKDEKK